MPASAVRRWGGRVGIRAHDIDRATLWFEKYGPMAVLVGRVVPIIRTLPRCRRVRQDAGASFGLYTTIGCIPWTAALGIAGYALGANWQNVANDFHGPTYVIAGVISSRSRSPLCCTSATAVVAKVRPLVRRAMEKSAEPSRPPPTRLARRHCSAVGPAC